jgi:predicted DNA-binding transcriptional regulator AlpA
MSTSLIAQLSDDNGADHAPPTDAHRLMLRDTDLAALLGVSPRHVWSLEDRGLIPAGVKFGKCKRWSRPVIEAWAAANCPPRDKWTHMQKGAIS